MPEKQLYIVIADLSLFAFEPLLNRQSLLRQLDDPELDVRMEIPSAIFELIQNNPVAFQSILRDINPNVSEEYLNSITRFLSENSNRIPRYELGSENDFDNIPTFLMRQIVGKIFRRAPDRINRFHIAFYYQVLHALEIGKAQSPLAKRKLIGYVHNFKRGITDSTDLLHNATLCILDSAKRGIVYCHDGFHAVGETLYARAKKIGAIGKDWAEEISKETGEYIDRKRKIIRYYFSDYERSFKSGAAILAFAGTSITTVLSHPSPLLMLGNALTGLPLLVEGIIFVIDGKEQLKMI